MFNFKLGQSTDADLSSELLDASDFTPEKLLTLEYAHDIAVQAFDPLAGLFAVGTRTGVIWLIGSRGVQERIKASDTPIKFLDFAQTSNKLICLDTTNRLHVWDLTQQRLQRTATHKFSEEVTCITTSPSHEHVFLGLKSGRINAYDLLCSRVSPFGMPCAWNEYRKKIGMPVTRGSDVPIALVIHPRDLNLIFICFTGAITLVNLKERSTCRVYELTLPPGAPGPEWAPSPAMLTIRNPFVSCMAVHPTGHFFAVGYEDGSIAFWATEDEDKPLLVRSIEQVDINMVNEELLNLALEPSGNKPSDKPAPDPIYKLDWSGYSNSADPRGGTHTLAVLGGGRGKDSSSVTIFSFSAFNPTDTVTDYKVELPPPTRKAMQDCLSKPGVYAYQSESTISDFLLLPRDTPHFAGNFDPIAIVLVFSGDGDERSIGITEFPPSSLAIVPKVQGIVRTTSSSTTDAIGEELAETLHAMQRSSDPERLTLPNLFWTGSSSVVGGKNSLLDTAPYGTLCLRDLEASGSEYGLRGGAAWMDGKNDDCVHAKFEPHRVLLTWHRDLTIRIQDISPHLLVSSEAKPLQGSFPRPLPSLTIDPFSVLSDPYALERCSQDTLHEGSLTNVYLTPESLECIAIFKTGDVFIYQLEPDARQLKPTDKGLVSLTHILIPPPARYHPVLMIPSGRGPISALGASDIGFFAFAHNDGSLVVLDMRGPTFILKDTDSNTHRHSFLGHSTADPFVSLHWTIFKLSSEKAPSIHLMAIRASGHTNIYTIEKDTRTHQFQVSPKPIQVDAVSQCLPHGSYVLDSTTGARCVASRSRYSGVVQGQSDGANTYWITTGQKGVKCSLNADGDRLGRVDFASKNGIVESAHVVRKHRSCVVGAFTDKGQLLVYSVPRLEHMYTVPVTISSPRSLSIDESGDYVDWTIRDGVVHKCELGTLFGLRRKTLYHDKVLDILRGKNKLPAQPQPVSMGPATLLGQVYAYVGSQSTTGAQIDALLGGPDRPIPQPKETTSTAPRNNQSYADRASAAKDSIASSTNDLYNRLGSAASERGQMLDGLEDTVNSLRTGSENMLAQAKRLAAEQSTRKWFNF
ncbi:hypothetical protein BDM02DRAFT_3085840 [Thelephora ganbajun]|uniref:Uncharacterized protein n=1 Tax=Thelephora ganbajun TaxID=370292 RepID=A0ACB6ZXI5_THEGA|nr:hypothetical protein BDM02DRAFT_3085840 [Thelephora ganbajun]